MRNVVFGCAAILLFTVSCGSSKTGKEETFQSTDKEDVLYKVEDQGSLETLQVQPIYRASETVFTDLEHTKLEVSFDWEKSQLKGIATITAHPHFYASSELVLDAKSMQINSVKIGGKDLVHTYADDILTITLDKTYKGSESFTVVIDYLAQPEERKRGW